jgi:hypothetical protein
MDREQRQRERGLCSVPDCDEPIDGWCATCDTLGPFQAPKWCAVHLLRHAADRLPEHHYAYLIPEPALGGAP